MPRRKRRIFTADQKAQAIRMAKELGNTSKAARDLGISVNQIMRWRKQALVWCAPQLSWTPHWGGP